jgi:hypothetical protein
MLAKPALVSGILVLVLMAGCASNAPKADRLQPPGDVPDIEATATTGGIHGFVVDERIVPIKGATVTVTPENKSTTTDASGAFAVSGLPGGTYFLKVSHPLYATIQQSVEVQAGVADPKDVKVVLKRVIAQTPYTQQIKYEGFIVCSVVTPVVLSEECGEGVGSPYTTCDEGLPPPCVANPVSPGQRIGHNAQNFIVFNFVPDAGLSSFVAEKVWEPTSEAGTILYSPISTHWLCAPNCGGNTFAELHGPSPLYAYIGPDVVQQNNLTPQEGNITIFTWAGKFGDDPGVDLNQKFTDVVTLSYYLPLPEGWSLVKGDPLPF